MLWPACDLREDRLLVDLSRLPEDLVGIRRRIYGVCRRTAPVPEYVEEIEYLALSRLKRSSG